ncbi:PAS domain-containing protein [Ferrovibrio sp.]|uniref:PAS domain-containing protein n=1 Tax=Ferrovibrio sp. TaxID=1917215 RepID=UPI00311E0E75
MRFADKIDEEDLRGLYRYWLSKKTSRFPPPRSSINPTELPRLLPMMFVIEVDHGQQRFRYRLAGQQVEDLVQTRLHGLWLDEALRSPLREFFDEGFCIAAFERKVHYRCNTLHLAGRPYIRYSRLLLPLSDDGERIDHLLGCIKLDGAINTRNPSQLEEHEITVSDVATFERDAYETLQ